MQTTYLCHHGIKGMHWGIRKKKETSGSKTTKKKSSKNKKTLGQKVIGLMKAYAALSDEEKAVVGAIATGSLAVGKTLASSGASYAKDVHDTSVRKQAAVAVANKEMQRYKDMVIENEVKLTTDLDSAAKDYGMSMYEMYMRNITQEQANTDYKLYKQSGQRKEDLEDFSKYKPKSSLNG